MRPFCKSCGEPIVGGTKFDPPVEFCDKCWSLMQEKKLAESTSKTPGKGLLKG